MSYKLILISVAGVQNFISNARKTIDFYKSSYSIMKYVKSIYEYIKKENSYIKDFKLLLPNSLDKDDLDIPNYFISEAKSDLNSDNLEYELRKYLKESIKKDKVNVLDLNVYIVIVDYDKPNNKYREAYSKLYEKLDGYKNNRFKDWNLDYKEYKIDNYNLINCTICGIKKGTYISKESRVLKGDDLHNYNIDKEVKDDEVLCEECLVKRKLSKSGDEKYPSTLDVAVLEWVNKLKGIGKEEELSSYNKKIISNFKNICISNFYHKNYLYSTMDINDDKREKYIKDLEALNSSKEVESNIKIGESSRYFALIKIDIDNLGKHFSGKYIDDTCDLESFQKDLSVAILEFAEKIKSYIKCKFDRNKIFYIYLGGDDLLFFCPLYKVFETNEFIDKKLGEIKVKDIEGYNKYISVSKSIVIAHDSTPLNQVIKLSRTSLEQAKEKFKESGKNALAISLINSSFTIRTAYLKNNYKNITTVKYLINSFKKDISSSLIFELERQLFLLGENMEFEEYEILMNVIMNVIEMISSRKIKKDSKALICLRQLISEFINTTSDRYFIDLKAYFNLLHILEKYSQEIKDELRMEGNHEQDENMLL